MRPFAVFGSHTAQRRMLHPKTGILYTKIYSLQIMKTIEEFFNRQHIFLYGTGRPDASVLPFLQLPYCISFALPFSKAVIAQITEAPTKLYFKHYRMANEYLDHTATALCQLLIAQGFDAAAIPASQSVSADGLAGTFPHKTAAVLCGLGSIGENGLLLTQKFGAGVRLSTVFTSKPLPQAQKAPDLCRHCGACAHACPAGAIYGTPFRRDAEMLDRSLCSAYMKKAYRDIGRGSVCGRCIAVCPLCK